MIELRKTTLIVTGASSGIGRALALELSRREVDLVLNARRGAVLQETASRCEANGVRVQSVPGNAADAGTASALVETALQLGNFRGFIHAAGVLHPGPFLWEYSEAQFREVFEASVAGAFQLIRFAVPKLLRQGEGGVAVFFGSGAAEKQVPGISLYSSAKAAEEHLVRLLAAECSEITSFVYRPGVVETRMQEQARSARGGAAPSLQRKFQSYKESGELLSPEQAAGALLHILWSDPQRFHGRVATWRDGV